MKAYGNLIQLSACFIYTVVHVTVASPIKCSRAESKLVRRFLNTQILPYYEEQGTVIPHNCPFAPSQDVYGYQEEKKFEESGTKWVCEICGKSFYEERFLDLHFDNRHPETKREGANILCLASLCDIFRCDVIKKSASGKSSYWDDALCKEEELHRKHKRCLDIINQCIPTTSDKQVTKKIFNHLNTTLCSYLTCDNYWEFPQNEVSPLSLVYYIMAGMILVLGMGIYFVLLRTELSQRTPTLLSSNENDENKQILLQAPENQEIRYRQGVLIT